MYRYVMLQINLFLVVGHIQHLIQFAFHRRLCH